MNPVELWDLDTLIGVYEELVVIGMSLIEEELRECEKADIRYVSEAQYRLCGLHQELEQNSSVLHFLKMLRERGGTDDDLVGPSDY